MSSGDLGEILTGISPECQQGNCRNCGRIFERSGEPVFCSHDCHAGDVSEFAKEYAKKYALPIVPHELAGEGIDCCGCLIVVERDGQADLACNECGAVVKTVLLADVERELLQIGMSGGVCSATCRHCGALQTFPGFDSIEAFVCRECGAGNAIKRALQ